MGAAASTGLPAALDKESAQLAAGDRFDEATFDSAAVDGTVTREQFLAAATSVDSAAAASSAESGRSAVTSALRAAFQKDNPDGRFMVHTDPRFMHGWLYDGPITQPKVLWRSDQKPRKDHAAPVWLTASEYEDVPQVMDAKVKQLAQLLRLSKHTVVYSGAGISASAVGQAALSGVNKTGWLEKTSAKPTMTHHALAILGQAGVISGWVQQNHDGLPQKAGFPQEKICEVHGSWYDPSNPVVKYSGSLKSHEAGWMEAEMERADLVLVLGTSLGGLNADRVATECAGRALGVPGVSCVADGANIRYVRGQKGPACLGSVIINLQQTAEDDKMTLKVSGRSDDVLVRLLHELGMADRLPADPKRNVRCSAVQCALVPYDANGMRLPGGSTEKRMWLNLAPGAAIKLISDGPAKHNHQGAKQPNTIHIGSKPEQKFGGKPIASAGSTPGHGKVVRREEDSCSLILQVEGAQCRLGIWWLEAAARGGPAMIPLVNQAPTYEGSPDPSKSAAAAAASEQRGGKAPAKGASSQFATAAAGATKKSGKKKLPPPPGVDMATVVAAAKAVDETMNAYAALAE